MLIKPHWSNIVIFYIVASGFRVEKFCAAPPNVKYNQAAGKYGYMTYIKFITLPNTEKGLQTHANFGSFCSWSHDPQGHHRANSSNLN